MSKAVELQWLGGFHRFELTLGGIEAVQEASQAGPMAILRRIAKDDWRKEDLQEVIRQGLIGGGMAPENATDLVHRVFTQNPLVPFRAPAMEILSAALIGRPDDPVVEDEDPGEGEGQTPAPMQNGVSAESTVQGR